MLSTDNPYMRQKSKFAESADSCIRDVRAAMFYHQIWKRKFMPERPFFFRLKSQLRNNHWEAKGYYF